MNFTSLMNRDKMTPESLKYEKFKQNVYIFIQHI